MPAGKFVRSLCLWTTFPFQFMSAARRVLLLVIGQGKALREDGGHDLSRYAGDRRAFRLSSRLGKVDVFLEKSIDLASPFALRGNQGTEPEDPCSR